jgi:hypothetical protein
MANWNLRDYIANNPERYAVKRIGQEYQVAEHFVKACMRKGWMISVFDGEAWPLKHSVSVDAILDAMASTDEDMLSVRDWNKKAIGNAFFVYGNSAGELISDHSCSNEAFIEVCKATMKWSEKFDG